MPLLLLRNSSTFCQLSLLLLVLVVLVVVDWQKRILFDIISAVCNFIFEPDSVGVGGGGARELGKFPSICSGVTKEMDLLLGTDVQKGEIDMK